MNTATPYAEYSETADALYVYFSDEPSDRTESLDDRRMIDWTGDGRLVGVEFLDVSAGVDLNGVPHSDQIASLLGEMNLKVRV
jgi:uncharacterized protein YuzE